MVENDLVHGIANDDDYTYNHANACHFCYSMQRIKSKHLLARKKKETYIRFSVLVGVLLFAASGAGLYAFITGRNQSVDTSRASALEPADLNNDNVVDIYDLTTLTVKWNSADALCDLNNDGIVSVYDLSMLLSKWGAVNALVDDLNIYFGTTHYHTGLYNNHGTDESTPADIFAKAKSSPQWDFLFLTEHSGPTGPVSKGVDGQAFYQEAKTAAANATNNEFVGLVGYEYSDNGGDGDSDSGHMTGYGTDQFVDASAPGMGFAAFLNYLVDQSLTRPVIGGFNHPGSGGHGASTLLTTSRRQVVQLSEVHNADESKGGDPGHFQGYVVALDRGWRVAPTCGVDGHGTWTLGKPEPGPCRTGLLATTLSADNILKAMQDRRVYASRDINLQAKYKANDRWMGSTIGRPSTVTFDITISDPDIGNNNDKVKKIEILGNGGALLASQTFDTHSANWRPSVSVGANKYMFIRVFNGERSGHTAVLAPIWLE